MKFKCGQSKEEKKSSAEEEEDRIKAKWHRIMAYGETRFAWWPTHLTDGTCAWLEKVTRVPVSYGFFNKHQYPMTGKHEWELAPKYLDQRLVKIAWEYEPYTTK